MNVPVDRMVQEGLIDESAARGINGLLASGEQPTRAFAACGLAEAMEVVADMIKALDDRTVEVADVRVFLLRYVTITVSEG